MKRRNGFFRRINLIYLAAIFSLIIFSGCATKEAVKNVSDEDVLRERVMTYWNHKIKKELDRSYEYEDPYYKKKYNMVSYIKSIHTGKAEWSVAKIESLKIDGDSAIVDMKIRMRVVTAPSKNIEHDVPLRETWVKVDGMWYHTQQKFRERQTVN